MMMPGQDGFAEADWRAGGFGLYVHWPFCQAKCPYCDFNSHVVPAVDQTRWAEALSSEITRLGAEQLEKFGRGASLAVSLEPPGGSPTGAPTGPVVQQGPVVAYRP